MAITSVGYPNPNVVNDRDWASIAQNLGGQYTLRGTSDLKVTTYSPADRTVTVAAGTAYGRGVTDTLSAGINIQLSPITGPPGTKRYDLVCLRRNWNTSTTTVDKVTGTSFNAIPASRNHTPGDIDDQPLAMVELTVGQTVPTAVIDVRAWTQKPIYLQSLAALSGLDLVPYQEVQITDVTYRMVPVGGGVLSAQPVSKPDFVLDQGTWYRSHYSSISLQTIPPNADRAVIPLTNRYGAGVDTPTQYIFNAWLVGLPVPNPASVTNIANTNAAGTALTVNLSGVTAGGTVRFAWTADWIGDI